MPVLRNALRRDDTEVLRRLDVDVPHHLVGVPRSAATSSLMRVEEVRPEGTDARVEDGVHEPQAVDVVVDVVQEERVQHLAGEVGERA